MRLSLYIFVLIFVYSCANPKESVLESTATEETDEIIATDAIETEVATDAAEEPENISTNAKETPSPSSPKIAAHPVNVEIIQQQLQETINLVGLMNSANLVEELYKDLEKTIEGKVKHAKINPNLGVIEVRNIEIQEVSLENEKTAVYFTFETIDAENRIKKGKAFATISNEFIKVDDVIYTDYQIYFDEITIPFLE